MPSAPTNGLIVTLVHGTWGRNSRFLDREARLRHYLARALDQPVGFVSFRWSGTNTHRARLNAGDEFAHFLTRVFDRYPNHEHALICHSHGGNVVQYALRQLECIRTRQRRICCVYIGTPFIDCPSEVIDHVRGLAEHYNGILNEMSKGHKSYFLRLPLVAATAVTLGAVWLNLNVPTALIIALPFVTLTLVYGLVWTLSRLSRRASDLGYRLNSYPLPISQLCLTVATDEPIGALKILSRLLSIITSGFQKARLALLFSGGSLLLVGAGLGCVIYLPFRMWEWVSQHLWVSPASNQLLRPDSSNISDLISNIVMVLAIVAAVGCVLLVLTVFFDVIFGGLLNLVGSHVLGFGSDSWSRGWFLRYQISRVPPRVRAEQQVFQTKDLDLKQKTPFFLRHSVLYSCDASLGKMCDFICVNTSLRRRVESSSTPM